MSIAPHRSRAEPGLKTTNRCGIHNRFSNHRFVEGDNGDLSDRTPRAGIVSEAFDLHATTCGAASDASNQHTGCPVPAAAPTLSACGTKALVQLDWTGSAGAREYRVLRNTLGCGFAFTPIGTAGGGSTSDEDVEVAPGVTYDDASTTDAKPPGPCIPDFCGDNFFLFVTRNTSCGESVAMRKNTGAPVPNNPPLGRTIPRPSAEVLQLVSIPRASWRASAS